MKFSCFNVFFSGSLSDGFYSQVLSVMVPLADGESEEEELLPSRRASLRFEIRSLFGGVYFCFICFLTNSISTSCFHADCFQGSTTCIIRDYAYLLQHNLASVKVISRHFLIFL